MSVEWKVKYPNEIKPTYNELLDYFEPHIRELFQKFDCEMREQYKVHNKYHRFIYNVGWIYGYGRSYNCELLSVSIKNDCFCVLGVSVKDEDSLQDAHKKVKKKYDNGFEKRYESICKNKRENQIIRTKIRVEREKIEMQKLIENIEPQKFNQFKWSKKVALKDINKLYQGEAKGLIDEELLEDVGLTFYIRCKQAIEVRELIDNGQMMCLQCGAVLPKKDYKEVVNCDCGYSYTFREYRRSCTSANMPGGRATEIFEYFTQKWPHSKETVQKMMLIDWLIHQCHITIMSGAKGRSVCVNLLEGTQKQIYDLINKLAYGENDKHYTK